MSDGAHPLRVRGKLVTQDEYGFVNLTDLWIAARGRESQKPAKWRQNPTTKRLVWALEEKVGFSYLKEKTAKGSAIYARLGRTGVTFAHPVLAAAYAGHIDSKLEVEIRETWLRARAGDATLADEILQRASAEANEWAARRAQSRVTRNHYTQVLASHGATQRGFPAATNAIYLQILGGSASELRRQLALAKKANVRDALDSSQLAFVGAAEALASERITEQECWGDGPCVHASERSAKFIKEAIERDREDRKSGLKAA